MRHYQDSLIEFRKKDLENTEYPDLRGIEVYQYGGTIEECIAQARKRLDLDETWEVVRTESPKV